MNKDTNIRHDVVLPRGWVPAQLQDPSDFNGKPSRSKKPQNPKKKKKPVREYTIKEEIVNSITHGIGALLAIAAIPLCTVTAVSDGSGLLLAGALIYSIFMLLEYLMSTLYHALQVDGAKRVFKVLDHSFIYLFIAATYTPYCLVTLIDGVGLPLCIFVWAVACIGVAAEAFWVFRPRWISAVLYLLLGWAIVWFIPDLYSLLDPAGFGCLLQAEFVIQLVAFFTCSSRFRTCIQSFIFGFLQDQFATSFQLFFSFFRDVRNAAKKRCQRYKTLSWTQSNCRCVLGYC